MNDSCSSSSPLFVPPVTKPLTTTTTMLPRHYHRYCKIQLPPTLVPAGGDPRSPVYMNIAWSSFWPRARPSRNDDDNDHNDELDPTCSSTTDFSQSSSSSSVYEDEEDDDHDHHGSAWSKGM
ncbi:hypothetical protein ACA910_022636 [Epithemia clementina (nom. ined.)]